MRHLLSVLTALLLTLPLAACGDDDGGEASEEISQAADQAPADEGPEIWPQDMGMGGAGNPHAVGGGNPHAGMGDPHAGMGAGGDPHAGMGMGGGPPPTGGAAPSPTGTAGGVKWEAPEAFQPQPVSSRMRVAQYAFGGGGQTPAEMVVYFFGPGQGGSVDENVQRWVNQFSQPDGSSSMEAADIEQKQVNGLAVTTVDVSGNFSAGMGPGQAGAGQRMLAAIARGPQGPVFFKMVGPEAQMQAALPAFEQLVQSFEPAGQGG